MSSAVSVEEMARNLRKSQGGRPTLPMNEAKRVLEAVEKLLERFGGRETRGSVTRLAGALGVAQPMVSQWLSGTSSPGVENLDSIARLLETTEYRIRKGTLADLETCLDYFESDRWPDRVKSVARRLASAMADEGKTMSPKSWEDKLDQLAKQTREQ